MQSALVLGLALVLAGCGEGDSDLTGVPQPDPLPLVSAVRVSSGDKQIRPLQVIGLPGAVAGAGAVSVTTARETYEAEATAEGTFAVQIEAALDEIVELRYKRSAAASLTILAACPAGVTCNVPPAIGPRPGVEPVGAPVAGQVMVSGSTHDQSQLLVVNFTSGEVRQAATDASGDFDVELGGATGDAIHVYRDSQPLDPPWVLTVP